MPEGSLSGVSEGQFREPALSLWLGWSPVEIQVHALALEAYDWMIGLDLDDRAAVLDGWVTDPRVVAG